MSPADELRVWQAGLRQAARTDLLARGEPPEIVDQVIAIAAQMHEQQAQAMEFAVGAIQEIAEGHRPGTTH